MSAPQVGRPLTAQEIAEARKVYGDRIDYSRPRVLARRHPLATRRTQILAPDGNIYWPAARTELADSADIPTLATFIHEMAHVMQYQCGVRVLARGCALHARRILSFGHYNPYEYWFEHGRPFRSYNIEQQAEIAVGVYFGWYPNLIDYELPTATGLTQRRA